MIFQGEKDLAVNGSEYKPGKTPGLSSSFNIPYSHTKNTTDSLSSPLPPPNYNINVSPLLMFQTLSNMITSLLTVA